VDVGALWENYLISERWKKNSYNNFYGHRYFWRTTQQQEIDYLEEIDGHVNAYEFKWSKNNKVKAPSLWQKNYTEASFELVNSENYLDFILPSADPD
jgi:hypothetical protein